MSQRLNAAELGLLRSGRANRRPELTQMNNDESENATVIDARYSEVSNSLGTVIIVLSFNLPQIIAALIVLAIYWSNPNEPCGESYTDKWKIWASVAIIRMSLYSAAVVLMYRYKSYFEANPSENEKITSFRNMVDGFGLVWFIIGNLWLFNNDDSQSEHCDNPEKSPLYNLCFSMVIITYIQICLPCILVALFLPLFCFCMPCLIRLAARLNSRATPGATPSAISTLPIITIDQNHLDALGNGRTCPICLDDIELGNEARLFQCNHAFHRACVDEWLSVNASCPTCRKSIFQTTANNSDTSSSSSSSSAVNTATVTTINSEIINPLVSAGFTDAPLSNNNNNISSNSANNNNNNSVTYNSMRIETTRTILSNSRSNNNTGSNHGDYSQV